MLCTARFVKSCTTAFVLARDPCVIIITNENTLSVIISVLIVIEENSEEKYLYGFGKGFKINDCRWMSNML